MGGKLYNFFRVARSAAFFGNVMDRSRNRMGNSSSKILFSGIILATTIGMAFQSARGHFKKRREIKAQKEHDAAMIEKAKITHGYYDKDKQSDSDTSQNAPQDNSEQIINPMETTPNNSAPVQSQQILNPADIAPDTDNDNPFAVDSPIGVKRFDLEANLIVMKVDPKSNNAFAIINTSGDEPDFYVTGSGIYNKDHQPYYKLGFESDKTFYLDKLLELINEHEYQDMLTLFETYEY